MDEPAQRAPMSRWSDLFDLFMVGLMFAFGYLVGERRTLQKVEEPAMRALSMERPKGAQPSTRSVMLLLEVLAELTTTDLMTGVQSRYRINLDLALAVATARANGAWLGLILIDLDHFKNVNDLHGHPGGDEVLGAVGRRLAGLADGDRRVGRYGGEEFLIVIPRGDIAAARVVAERALELIRSTPVQVAGVDVAVTASAGVAAGYGDYLHHETFVEAADQAMYRAKDDGRDRVALADVLGAS
jgi:diguanylate cyclase (GGDEF)-like protein